MLDLVLKEDVREFIDLFVDMLGLIIDGSNCIPAGAKPEKVGVMLEAVLPLH